MPGKTKTKKGEKRKSKAIAWRWPLIIVGVLGFGALGISAYEQYGPVTIEPDTMFEGQDLGGLTRDEAHAKLVSWQRENGNRSLIIKTKKFDLDLTVPYSEAGVEFDPEATLRTMPVHSAVRAIVASRQVNEQTTILPNYRVGNPPVSEWSKLVEEKRPEVAPARATFDGGRVVTKQEVATWALDESGIEKALMDAVHSDQVVTLPLKGAAPRVSDERLAEIKTVVSEFTTRFNAGQVARCANIKRASEIINGVVLLPGETWSFNGRVEKRTTARGFQTAGVYVSGRHDFDIGGGICQVSTTLYNAVLLSDLKVKSRNPHSLPVPYVPLGRDAAVSFPQPDFAFENNTNHAIAISATYVPGQLTFRILGPAKSPYEMEFVSQHLGSWSNGVKYIVDASLGYGEERTEDRGGSGQKVKTTRILKQNGEVVRRDDLGISTYSGGPRIVARNPSARAPQAAPNPGGTPVEGTPDPATPVANP